MIFCPYYIYNIIGRFIGISATNYFFCDDPSGITNRNDNVERAIDCRVALLLAMTGSYLTTALTVIPSVSVGI